jgi:cyclase
MLIFKKKSKRIFMNRRHFVRNFSLSSSVLMMPLPFRWLANSLIAQQYVFKEIRKGVGYFEGRGGTIGWSVNNDGCTIIDTQFVEQAGWLLGEMQKDGWKDKIDLLINTHHHADHTSGNILFKGMIEKHVAHVNAINNYTRVVNEQGSHEKALIPDISFESTAEFSVGNERLKLLYFGRAHTNGDAIVHYQNANVAHLADLIFNRRFPFIDRSSGASISSWIDVLDQVDKSFDQDTIFIFGHKDNGYEVTGGLEDVKAFKNYLEHLMEHMQQCINKSMSLDDIKIETKMIPGASEWKGDGIYRSIEAAFLELTEG